MLGEAVTQGAACLTNVTKVTLLATDEVEHTFGVTGQTVEDRLDNFGVGNGESCGVLDKRAGGAGGA